MSVTRWLARSVVVVAMTAVAGVVPVASQARLVPTFVVNSTGNASDVNLGNGICATSTNKCTLRAAIEEANSNANLNAINFNIPCSLPCLFVNLSDGNFAINNPVIIDGTTQ